MHLECLVLNDCHTLKVNLFLTSVIVSGETVVPDQKCIGVFLQNPQIPTAIKTNSANTDAIEKYITSVKTFLSLKKTHELSPTNFFLAKAKNVSSEQIRVDF